MKYHLGDTLRCLITGVTGKCSQVSKHIYSENRYNIQPPYNSKEGKMPSSFFMDESSLTLVEKSDLPVIHQYIDGNIVLGDIVLDTLSEIEAKSVERALCVNGCYRLKLLYKDKKTGHPHHFWAEEKGLEVVKSVHDTPTKPENRKTGSAMEEIPW